MNNQKGGTQLLEFVDNRGSITQKWKGKRRVRKAVLSQGNTSSWNQREEGVSGKGSREVKGKKDKNCKEKKTTFIYFDKAISGGGIETKMTLKR